MKIVDNCRAIAVAINSLHFNPNLSDVEIQSYELALAEIRDYMAQQEDEKNEPLTLDELRKMDGQPVWLFSNRDNFACWGIVRVFTEIEGHPISVSCAERIYSGENYYEKLWLAYRRPPKEELHES